MDEFSHIRRPVYNPIPALDKMERKLIDGKRFYISEKFSYPIPSVTTILSETNREKKERIKEWRQRVGEAEANMIMKQATGIGTAVHSIIENFLLHGNVKLKNNFSYIRGKNLAKIILEKEISTWDETLAIEYYLYYPGLYAGTADIIFRKNGKTYLGDFKTSRKMKCVKMIEDYIFQLAAYKFALEEHGLVKIDKAKIMMVSLDGDFTSFEVEGYDLEGIRHCWFDKVEDFFQTFYKEKFCYGTS